MELQQKGSFEYIIFVFVCFWANTNTH